MWQENLTRNTLFKRRRSEINRFLRGWMPQISTCPCRTTHLLVLPSKPVKPEDLGLSPFSPGMFLRLGHISLGFQTEWKSFKSVFVLHFSLLAWVNLSLINPNANKIIESPDNPAVFKILWVLFYLTSDFSAFSIHVADSSPVVFLRDTAARSKGGQDCSSCKQWVFSITSFASRYLYF